MEVAEILKLMPTPEPGDEAFIRKAYTFAAEAHKEHKRFSGEPYLVHLVETAKGLAKLGMGAKTIAAGLLHDSIEDAGISAETIEKEFGKDVRFLVEGVTKLGHFKYRGAERHRESLRKLLVATGQDARVLIIKLMDRLHNMRTIEFVPPEKRQRIALETLEIYAAIAHRLGMGVVRKELEDLAFQYAYPEEYAEAKKMLGEAAKESADHLEEMVRTLGVEVTKEGITEFDIDHRTKGLWSFWQKVKRKGGDVGSVYDIAALRVIVPDVADCYRVLGVVHKLWQPLPNKIKDYIAFPKPNGYQGLHTTVFSGMRSALNQSGIVEIQIRTREMHHEAQYGIAAHVMYKEGATGESHQQGTSSRQSSFDWIKSLIPGFRKNLSQKIEAPTEDDAMAPHRLPHNLNGTPDWLADLKEEEDNPEFETTLKTDIFSHRVFVFTPNGDVVDLPINSSPIDFAYAIHSDIGDHVFGAKVNGKMVPLDTTLKNGDIVEIQTKKSATPKAKWLDFTKTTLARRHIRTALEKQQN